ncbi:hypothetical protein HQ544_03380 [Candidatus Falkowbacteria bacterium]|nr:hypothetical protein [Candidatus Falkowbacteria bacterium]
MQETNKKQCPKCESFNIHEEIKFSPDNSGNISKLNGLTFEAKIPRYRCNDCRKGFF